DNIDAGSRYAKRRECKIPTAQHSAQRLIIHDVAAGLSLSLEAVTHAISSGNELQPLWLKEVKS
ncbi:MAG: hypothetical protein OSA97_12500, partial [Nevskia sp.]|nr:hypothetical protein [Nevskia sp.]